MSGMFEAYIEDIKKEEFEKEALKRPMASELKVRMKPQMIISYNPQTQQSQLMVKRLDNVLSQIKGLRRMEITALNEMIDQAAIKEMGVPKLGITLMARGKVLGTLPGVPTEMDIRKFIMEHKGKLV